MKIYKFCHPEFISGSLIGQLSLLTHVFYLRFRNKFGMTIHHSCHSERIKNQGAQRRRFFPVQHNNTAVTLNTFHTLLAQQFVQARSLLD